MTLPGSSRRPARPGRPVPRTRPAGLAGPRLAGTVLAVAVAGLLAAACSGAGAPAASGASRLPAAGHAAPSVLPATTPAATATAGTASAPASPPPAASAAPPAGGVTGCATAGLRVSIGRAGGAAGSIYYPIQFRNVSGAACTMYGYPGVSFVAGPGGGQIGGEAARDPAFPPAMVTLAPGAVAHASVQVVVAQDYSAAQCKPVTAHFLRIYPPGQLSPLYLGLTALTCTGPIPGGTTLGIYVVRPGANGV
jgi:hypothetical protein